MKLFFENFWICHALTAQNTQLSPPRLGITWKRGFKWPNPTPSLTCPGYYKTYLEIDELDTQHYQTGFLKDFLKKILKDFGVKVLILLINLISFWRNWGLHKTHPLSNYTKIISSFHLPFIAKRCTGDKVGIALIVTD